MCLNDCKREREKEKEKDLNFLLLFQYELLFSVEDEKDPAILVVNSLISNYPRVDARLFVGKTTFNLTSNLLHCFLRNFRFYR